jgi:hypothetical protein
MKLPHQRRGEPGSYALTRLRESATRLVTAGAIPYGARVVHRAPTRSVLGPILATAACALPSAGLPGDREHYLAALTEGPLASRLEHCRAIEGADLQGDCLTALVAEGTEPVETLCAEIQHPAWRDECSFVAAERAIEGEDFARAAALCRDAGRYAENCTAHAWQTELREALGTRGVEAMVDDRAAVEAVHDRWSERFGPSESFEHIFWPNCYRMAFERTELLQVSACERVPTAERDACLRGAATTYRNWLHHTPLLRDGKDRLCSANPDALGLAEASTLLEIPPTEDHPILARVLHGFITAICRDGVDPRAPSDRLPSPDMRPERYPSAPPGARQ